ncbi:MAG: hypothetical protein Ta2A_19670 [Treponemataceae bacterium]|nr:MAG: hypothetical protein Ta2A_19670 [Treponemataceae bacterium]
MKKTLVVAGICLALGTLPTAKAAAEAPKFSVSVGGGGSFAANFSTWRVDEDVPGDLNRYDTAALGSEIFFFFDATYFEADIGALLTRLNAVTPPVGTVGASDDTANVLGLRFSLFLKYPFAASDKVTLFPLLGAAYELSLLAKHDGGGGRIKDTEFQVSASKSDAKALEALSAVWFKAGLGADVNLTDHLFLRTELVYGVRLPNETEKYKRDARSDVVSMLGHGGDFKFAVGYRF